MKKYAIVTFGCRVNQADSLALEADLRARGGEPTTTARADLVIVNTCSVTASADQGARQAIRRIARENPAARIVATGCFASRCGDEVAALPGVARVVPNDVKHTIPLLLDREAGPCGRPLAPGLMGRTAWTVRVQTGCDEQCSYCIIPRTRGPGRSRTPADVAAEVARMVDAGYREIVITGVHLGSYGRDLAPPSSLAALMETLCTHDVLFRISSLEPMDFPLTLLDLPIAPHFHLPLQHASGRVLGWMRRPYTLAVYRALVETIRARLPHAAIGTDVIAGFPGETDEDFAVLAAYLETSPITHAHVFPYSDRPETEASARADKVHGLVIKERAARLRAISRQLADRFRAAQRGTIRPALTIEDGSVAVTDNYFRVAAPPGHERNERITVAIS